MTGTHRESVVDLVVDGVPCRLPFSEQTIRLCHNLLAQWTARQRELGRRMVVFLAAPPGAGKSTFASLLARLSREDKAYEPLVALPLDGFHYHADVIATGIVCVEGRQVPMREVKGTLETFDHARFAEKCGELCSGGAVSWPRYDRNIHDVIDDAIVVPADARLVLVEGNWLLSSESPWDKTRSLADASYLLVADKDLLHRRLVARKVRGGLTPEAAEEWYMRCDGMNVRRVLAHSSARNMLVEDEDGSIWTSGDTGAESGAGAFPQE